jgi:hypothetical protein
LIDPRLLPSGFRIFGPKWVAYGGGVEYILVNGFPREAIVDVGSRPDTKWEIEVS